MLNLESSTEMVVFPPSETKTLMSRMKLSKEKSRSAFLKTG